MRISLIPANTFFFKNKSAEPFFFFFYLFIFGCIGSSLRCTGFSSRRPLPLQSTGSRRVDPSSCGTRAPERRLSSRDARAQPLHDTRDPPEPGPEPASPAPAGGLPTTEPPGKPLLFLVLTTLTCMKWHIIVLICIFLSNNEVEHLFTTLLAIQVFSSFASLSIVLFVFYYYYPLLFVGVLKIYV